MTRSVATRVLGVIAVAAAAVMVLLALWVSPPDVVQGDAVRLMYLHVPSIWVAYGSFVVTAAASARLLWRSRAASPSSGSATAMRRLDRIAGAAAELGVLFTALTLLTGSLWGNVTWGTYWQWDARLTTTVLLFVTYLGYLALRRLPSEPRMRARRAAVMALIATVNLPIVHFSVDWWRTLHQEASLSVGRRPEITGEMFWTLMFSWAAVTVIALWLGVHRFRVLRLEELAEEEAIAHLLEERRVEQSVGPPDDDQAGAR
ncbi:cytochrome c biogenesis protein CcsA [Candidatus Poriferisodalis sp.]|uniref:cytochrome c biogenesis protein CcsA n=1 Tax=Candidatus Poriferisodalis sp. TaxID=3101277 RepID=UPI003B013B20